MLPIGSYSLLVISYFISTPKSFNTFNKPILLGFKPQFSITISEPSKIIPAPIKNAAEEKSA